MQPNSRQQCLADKTDFLYTISLPLVLSPQTNALCQKSMNFPRNGLMCKLLFCIGSEWTALLGYFYMLHVKTVFMTVFVPSVLYLPMA